MMWPRVLGTLLFALALGGCAEPLYTNIDNAQLKALVDQGVPLYDDIRREGEWRSTGVMEGSRNLTYVDKSGRLNPEFLPGFTAEEGKDTPVVLICRTGSRTESWTRTGGKMGCTRVYNVRYGITGLIAENHSVVKNQKPGTKNWIPL